MSTRRVHLQDENIRGGDYMINSPLFIPICGAPGTTGLSGPTGIQGVTGVYIAVGTQGVTGLVGLAGVTGLTGPTGDEGVTGIRGTTGIKGLTGLQGPGGNQGGTGIKGATGIQGVTGLTGSVGLTGIQGLRGLIGLTGYTGITGRTGIAGTQGNTGLVGPAGTGTTSKMIKYVDGAAGIIGDSNTTEVSNGLAVSAAGECYVSLCESGTEKVWLTKENSTNDFLVSMSGPGEGLRVDAGTANVCVTNLLGINTDATTRLNIKETGDSSVIVQIEDHGGINGNITIRSLVNGLTHDASNIMPTNANWQIQPAAYGTNHVLGGAKLTAITSNSTINAVFIDSINSSDTVSPPIVLKGSKISGAGQTALAATDPLLTIQNNTTPVVSITGDGHMDVAGAIASDSSIVSRDGMSIIHELQVNAGTGQSNATIYCPDASNQALLKILGHASNTEIDLFTNGDGYSTGAGPDGTATEGLAGMNYTNAVGKIMQFNMATTYGKTYFTYKNASRLVYDETGVGIKTAFPKYSIDVGNIIGISEETNPAVPIGGCVLFYNGSQLIARHWSGSDKTLADWA